AKPVAEHAGGDGVAVGIGDGQGADAAACPAHEGPDGEVELDIGRAAGEARVELGGAAGAEEAGDIAAAAQDPGIYSAGAEDRAELGAAAAAEEAGDTDAAAQNPGIYSAGAEDPAVVRPREIGESERQDDVGCCGSGSQCERSDCSSDSGQLSLLLALPGPGK